ncbi:hypothetical protein EEB19_22215 [Gordonia sp. OPL2]|nr:hypothetical protein EEB19_22215 [Gordonia sp. OPL2]
MESRNGQAVAGVEAHQVWPSIGEGVLNLSDPVSGAGAWVSVEDMRRAETEAATLREALRRAELDRDTAREEITSLMEQDRERNAAAREWADDNDLCDRFERFCEAYGWQGRTDDMTVTVRVSVDVDLIVPGVHRGDQDTYSLTEQIDDTDVREKLEAGAYALNSYDVTDYERA